MFLRSLPRGATATTVLKQSRWRLSIYRSLASTNPAKPIPTKGRKPKSRFDAKEIAEEIHATDPLFSVKEETELRRRQLAEDEKNPTLDVGPNGRPLFTSAPSISSLTKDDVNTYVKFRMEEWKEMLPEGLPMGMMKEFETSSRSALLVRQSFIDLRDNFRRAADPLFVLNNEGSLLLMSFIVSILQ